MSLLLAMLIALGVASALTRPALDALGIPHATLARMDEVEFLTGRLARQCFQTRTPTALILSPLLTGGNTDV